MNTQSLSREGEVLSSTEEARPARSRWRRLTGNSSFVLAAFLVCFVAVGLMAFGEVIAPSPATVPDPSAALQPPSWAHPFGTDRSGFDVFSRVLAAPRVNLGIAFIGTALALLIGAPLGLFAGFHAGRRSPSSIAAEGVMRAVDIIQAFPVFILALAFVAVVGPGAFNVVVAVIFVNVPIYLRLFRSETLSVRERGYIDAAKVAGVGEISIIRRHVLPNAMASALVQISVSIGMAIMLTAGLSFVGAGVRVPTPEWGSMISLGAPSIVTGHWWPSVFPGLAMAITVLSFGVAGQALGDWVDPRKRGPR